MNPATDPGIFYLTMDDADVSGTTYTDRGSGGNNGTAVNGPLTSVAGAKSGLGQARSFNGSNQVLASALTDISFASGSIAFWHNPTTTYNSSTIQIPWSQQTSSLGGECSFQHYSDNNLYIGWWSGSVNGNRIVIAASATNWRQNQWDHFVYIWTPTTQTLYQNGVSIASNSLVPPVSNLASSVKIGGRVSFSADYSSCTIDEFRIYDRALSSGEVGDLYNFNGASASSGLLMRRRRAMMQAQYQKNEHGLYVPDNKRIAA